MKLLCKSTRQHKAVRRDLRVWMLAGILLFSLFLGTVAHANATEVTVGAQGQYKTIQQAVNASESGGIIRVAPGAYTENVVVSKSLTIIAAGGRPTVTAATSSQDVITVASSNVRIEGLTVTGGVNGVHIHNASKCAVVNVVSRDNDRAGIYLAQSVDNVISNCNLAGNGYGVYGDTSSRNTISSNVATGAKGSSASLGDGIFLNKGEANTITHNNLSANHVFGISIYTSPRNIISNNTIRDNDLVGIRIGPGSNNNSIAFNIFSRNGQTAQTGAQEFPPSGILIVSATGNQIYLNSFISQSSALIGGSAAILNSPEKMVYTYDGVERTGYMSNYYSEYNGTDKNGTGIGSTPSSYGDKYPLIKPVANYGTITPVSAVKTTTSTPHGQNESTKAVSGNQSVSGSLLPGFEVASTLAGLVVALLLMLGRKPRAR